MSSLGWVHKIQELLLNKIKENDLSPKKQEQLKIIRSLPFFKEAHPFYFTVDSDKLSLENKDQYTFQFYILNENRTGYWRKKYVGIIPFEYLLDELPSFLQEELLFHLDLFWNT